MKGAGTSVEKPSHKLHVGAALAGGRRTRNPELGSNRAGNRVPQMRLLLPRPCIALELPPSYAALGHGRVLRIHFTKKEAAGAQASAWLRFGPAEQAFSFFWPNHGKENPAGSPFAEGAVTGYFRRNRFGLAAYAATEYGLFMARGRKAKKLRAIMRRRLETREFSRR